MHRVALAEQGEVYEAAGLMQEHFRLSSVPDNEFAKSILGVMNNDPELVIKHKIDFVYGLYAWHSARFERRTDFSDDTNPGLQIERVAYEDDFRLTPSDYEQNELKPYFVDARDVLRGAFRKAVKGYFKRPLLKNK
jgi:hypothetical protein